MIEETYIEGWRKRLNEERWRDKTQAESALSGLSIAVTILKKYNAQRILLCGSLAKEGCFRQGSDIDLAVEGIKRTDFVRAYADLMFALDWPVDLKPLEEIHGPLKETVLKRGRIIYERQE